MAGLRPSNQCLRSPEYTELLTSLKLVFRGHIRTMLARTTKLFVMQTAGAVLFVIGCILAILGEFLLLKIAFRRGFGWLVACLVCAPFCWAALLVLDFKTCRKPVALAVLGTLAAGAGAMMAGIELR